MLIGLPKEIKNHDYRVGLTPASVRELTSHGHQVMVQNDAGAAIGLTDAQYLTAGATLAKADICAKQLMHLPGVGPTSATALISTIGHGRDFRSGRQLSAWLGLVPGQYSSGGKQRLGHITKAGDPYLRSLLVLGARAVLVAAKNKTDPISQWAISLAERRGYWRAIVSIAAKNARVCWAVLNRGEAFRLPA